MQLNAIAVLLLTFALIGRAESDSFQFNKYAGDDALVRLPETAHGPFETFQPSNYLRQQLILGPALNVTVREGDAAMMPCIAPHLGDKTVSWIRQRDLAILASGGHVYTSDPRITSVHPAASDLWGLQISPVRVTDEGIYQCQVNTEPKQSQAIVLAVLEQDLKDSPNPSSSANGPASGHFTKTMTLKVGGSSERIVPEGGFVILVCSVTFQEGGLLPRNVDIAWWHKGIKFEEKTTDPRITVNQITGASGVTTELEIQGVNTSDSGNYFCKVEPRFLNHQPKKPIILRETRVSVKVLANQLQNAVIPLTPSYFVFIFSIIFLFVDLYKNGTL